VQPDRSGFQPRIGLAWRPLADSSIVVRAGYGVYRDRAVYRSIAEDMAQQSPFSKNVSVDNGPLTPLTLASGFAVSPTGAPNTFAIDPEFQVGHTQNWQLSIQRDMPSGLQVTATYVGVKGTDLPRRRLPNTVPSGTTDTCAECPAGYVYLTSNGSSSQHAGTIALRRRQRNGLAFNVQYTWSKAIDDAGIGGFHIAQDWKHLGRERALSDFDRRHQMLIQTFYTTGMLGRLERTWHGWIGTLLREWTLTTEWKLASGTPMTPIMIAPLERTGVTGHLRPDRTNASLYTGSEDVRLNPEAFSPPAPGEWGNAGRNSITGPGQFSLDASVGRTFRASDSLVIDLRVDVTNVLNHVTFPDWDTVVDSTQFGLPTHASPMRMIRPTFRLTF
jgi:hypothetical protein